MGEETVGQVRIHKFGQLPETARGFASAFGILSLRVESQSKNRDLEFAPVHRLRSFDAAWQNGF
jgi:hypothetical protein